MKHTLGMDPTTVHPIEGSEFLGALANVLHDRFAAEYEDGPTLLSVRDFLAEDPDGLWTYSLGPLLDRLEAACAAWCDAKETNR